MESDDQGYERYFNLPTVFVRPFAFLTLLEKPETAQRGRYLSATLTYHDINESLRGIEARCRCVLEHRISQSDVTSGWNSNYKEIIVGTI
jgi:hypothetical protein